MKALLTVALVFASTIFVHAGGTSDYQAALVKAKAKHKLVLLDFTGSDWCEYCQALEKEVLSKPAFKHFAEANYILVTVDFPHQKGLPEEVKLQNSSLRRKFKVHSYPTLIVVDAEGKELGRQTSYKPGTGPEQVISRLKSFKKTDSPN